MHRKYSDCLRLNLRVAKLALTNRWIDGGDVERSYDRLSGNYEQSWLEHLRPITHRLMERLPDTVSGTVFDLGCGTGETTRWLCARYPQTSITAQDISQGMLDAARNAVKSGSVVFVRGDMLDFLRQQPGAQAELIVSAWAIGYSKPAEILREASRVLQAGGRFAFVVNLMDTLRPIYIAFRKTMQHHPGKLCALSFPRFPRTWNQLEQQARAAGLTTEWSHEGRISICDASDASLDWLLTTGILAGFDAMLPLQDDPAVADCFESYLIEQTAPLEHHYIMAVLQK
ncbi:MAG: methyltransferase domain-containing protein [Pontiellaceae bacterium]|nr:methyltransferase domain-containing protein [Pontiellaceae bacterium]MBN2783504.1 methyltransferase domain-containing protein [Pontiellaceae bacterium]